MSPVFLLSNDDGIDAPGLNALAAALADAGEVWVVAPDRERSATSQTISLNRPLRLRQVGERAWSVDGTPTDCVYLALHHLGITPDVVLGGINHGPNLGNDVLYSGTVAVAMQGALFGYPALALSLALGRETPDFDVAAEVGAEMAQQLLEDPPRTGVMLNVNVPPVPRAQLAGVRLCRLGYTDWADAVGVRNDPRGKPYYWIGGIRQGHDGIPDSDNNGLAQNYVTVTPIHYDLTDYRAFSWARGIGANGLPRVEDSLGDEPIDYPPHPRR